MIRATEKAHHLMRQIVKPGDLVVDATVGNGNDTLLLAELVGPSGRVIGFDIQSAAISATRQLVGHLPQVTLIQAGHETLAAHLQTFEGAGDQPALAAAMFNLGYLPGVTKKIVTQTETSLAGLEQALAALKINGLVTLVLYPGHPGGADEAAALKSYAQNLPGDFSVTHHARTDTQRPAPELLAITRVS
jgi:predicted methyltransferase